MYSTILSCSLLGMEAHTIKVEADISDGLPSFTMVGYLSSEVKEASERIRSALRNSKIPLPPKRITVNLSPADLRKEGNLFDLPIALSVLAALEVIPSKYLEGCLAIGELSLKGEILPVPGVLPVVMHSVQEGVRTVLLPTGNAKEGAVIQEASVIPVATLEECIRHIKGDSQVEPFHMELSDVFEETEENGPDFSEVHGQKTAKRAVEIAAAAMHNLLLIGSPGAGKSMMAQRIPGILPELTLKESIDITRIYSVAGKLEPHIPLITKRPFCAPHHTISVAGLAGGGKVPKPGMISLAHKGVLFLDELPEFSRQALEVMRQPLEDKKVHIVRVNGSCVFPADFMLVAALNPCPCGYYPDASKCNCTPTEVHRYLGKISGPLLDRMDLCVQVTAPSYGELRQKTTEESSAAIRNRVIRAQKIQKERYEEEAFSFNSGLDNRTIETYCKLQAAEERLAQRIFESLQLSARGYHRMLKVARTIADLEGETDIQAEHIREAVFFRVMDKKFWGGYGK